MKTKEHRLPPVVGVSCDDQSSTISNPIYTGEGQAESRNIRKSYVRFIKTVCGLRSPEIHNERKFVPVGPTG